MLPHENSKINWVYNRYQILKKLGEGGMGVVYLVRDTFVGENEESSQIALKFLPEGAEQKSIEAFKREFSVLTKLSHPHIAR